jgi:hypothetical protein
MTYVIRKGAKFTIVAIVEGERCPLQKYLQGLDEAGRKTCTSSNPFRSDFPAFSELEAPSSLPTGSQKSAMECLPVKKTGRFA